MPEFWNKINWSTLITMVVNFAVIIWFAATVSAKLEQLDINQQRQNLIMDRMIDKLAQHDVEIAVLKAQRVSVDL